MKAVQDNTKDVVVDISNDIETNPPDYSTHQHNNSISIIHELPTLQQHARGVLLVGSVLGAAGLPFPTPLSSSSDVSSKGGDLSFKILFIEGGNQPAMFRCKTPIYSSDTVTISKNPKWDNGIFHFDMIMPESNEDLKSEYGFVIQGEISITIYQSRASGGNNIIGQATFDLADIVKTGTVEFFQAGYEGRSVTGSHLLLSRTRDIVGEVDVQLNIAWKSMKIHTTTTTATTDNGSNIINKAEKIRSSSAVAGKRLPKQLDSSTNKTSGNSKAPSSKRPTTANITTTAPIKIVSKLQKKQKEDNKRIDQENLRMLKLLQQYGNTKDVYSNIAKDSSIVVNKDPTTVITTEMKLKDSDDAYNNDNKKKSNMKVSSSVDNSNSGSSSHEYYLNLFNNLKKEIRQETQENDKLKSRLSTLKISVNKAELTINKIKGSNVADSKRGSTSNRSSSSSSSNNGYSKMQFESNFMNNLSMEAAAKDDDDSRRRPINDSKDELKLLKQNTVIITTPVVTPLTDDELIAMNINDMEYRSLAEEYNVLQSVRRGLIDRLIIAKKTCQKADNTQSSISERTRFLQRRLSYLQDIVGEKAVNIAHSLINMNHTDLVSKGDDDDDNGGNLTKRISVSPQTQVEIVSEKSNDYEEDDDYLLFDRLRGAKEQDELETSIYESKTHFLSHDSSILELKGIFEYLQDKYNRLKTMIDNYREESKMNQSELYELTKNDRVSRMRENISKMKLRLKMLQLQSKLKMVDDEQFTVDAELSSFRYRQLRLMEAVQSEGFRSSGFLPLDKNIYNSTSHVDANNNNDDANMKNDDTQVISLKKNFDRTNDTPTISVNNQSEIVISKTSKDLEAKSNSPSTTTTTTTTTTGAMKPKKVKKQSTNGGGGARFSDDVVSSVVYTETMMMINDQDRENLYYNSKDEDAFKLQMSEELDKADGLGLSWQQWMDATDDVHDEKSTLDLTLTTNPNALVNNDDKDRNLI